MGVSLDIYMDEQSFIDACIAGEESAMKLLYEEYYPILMPICLRYAANEHEAQDILQEGFIKVFRYLAKYKSGTSLHSWMKRIMINTSIDFYRKRSRKRTEDIDHAYNVSCTSPDALDQISAEEIMKALQILPPTYRTVFNLYIVEGYSHKEIGELLGITDSTSRSNLAKARNKLKILLSQIHDYER